MADLKVAVVTGGVQGLGASITKALLDKGYRVVVADIQEERGIEFAEELGKTYGPSRILFHCCNVTNPEDFIDVFEFTIKEFQRIDVLVNNAGVIGEDNPQRILNINVMGVLNGIQTALRYMGKSNGGNGGFVVNTASIAGFITHPAFPVYCASKHAVVALTRSYGHAYYVDKEGLVVSALCPTYIKTDLLDNLSEKSVIKGIDFTSNEKILNSDDVAQGVLKLLEDKINGATLVCTKDEGFFYVGLQKEFENITLE